MYLFGHEVGGDDGGRAGPAHHAVHHDSAAPTHGLLDELVRPREKPVDRQTMENVIRKSNRIVKKCS